ncbi:MAG: alanyl-tRNA editing protein [Candidatus Gracilibacteria bacterium]|nr:alanyl-tRNA editing protein [Candidatus Gracilibacteria bacterium]MDP2396425.1 alanyl-tRNA editing protein [bacterium]MDP3381454.1 alanyl-tRNA editing protein [bacterium]
MTKKSYLMDSSILSGNCTITDIIEGENIVIRLSETFFYPQGGGQKSDIGTIGNVNVIKVMHSENFVDHIVDKSDGLKIGNNYDFEINQDHRNLQTRYHTAGHLIASVIENKFSELTALAGHQWPGEARVEFEGNVPKDLSLEIVQTLINEEFESNLVVEVQGDPFSSRKVKIGGFNSIPCGGTHVKQLKDIGLLIIDSAKEKKGRFRVSYHLD